MIYNVYFRYLTFEGWEELKVGSYETIEEAKRKAEENYNSVIRKEVL